MRPFSCLALSMVLLLALSGCLDSERVPGSVATGSTASHPAPEPMANESFGAIAGTIMDEEQRPLRGVKVVLIQTLAEAVSDEGGRFTFNGLEAGTYELLAERIGYEQVKRRVEVGLHASTPVTITMQSIVIPDEAYHIAITRSAHLHAGHAMLTWTVQDIGYVNVSSVNQALCEGCQFVIHFPKAPKQVVTEAVWSPGTAGTNADVWMAHYKNRTGASTNYAADYSFYIQSRGYQDWPQTALDKWKAWDILHGRVHGGLTTANVEHRVTLWYSFSYNGPLPEDYSALPPS